MNGPALSGEGIAQNQVDDLLSGDFDAAPAVAPAEAAAENIEIEVAPEVQSEVQPEAQSDPVVDAAAKFLNGASDADEIVNGAGPSEEASQDDIDAMFGSDDAVEEAAPESKPEPEPEPEPEMNGALAADADAASDNEVDADADDDQPNLDDIVPLTSDMGETASQDDINALFD